MKPRLLYLTVYLLTCGLLSLIYFYAPGRKVVEKAYRNITDQIFFQPVLEPSPALPLDRLKEIAEGITVKVLAQPNFGSGVIIGQSENTYQVLTNAHVLTLGKTYQIKTSDGKVHEAKLLARHGQNSGKDLAILQFNSQKRYRLAALNLSELKLGQKTFVIGFPLDSQELKLTTGEIAFLAEQPLKDGYQIGYTNTTEQGMSGSPVLNEFGEVIGLHGLGSFPVLNSAYTYQDGSHPSENSIQKMRQFSFGIPSKNLSLIL